MTSSNIVGLYSPAPGSGKTMIAGMISERGHAIVPFAGTLKDMVVPMLIALGYSHPRAWELVLQEKETKIPELGVTVRHMLQTLGTEWGRQCLHPDVWLACWRKKTERYGSVVADDVRFMNEAKLVKELGGQVWLVRRPGVQAATGHSSEGGLDVWEFDRVIENDGTLDELRSKVMAALR